MNWCNWRFPIFIRKILVNKLPRHQFPSADYNASVMFTYGKFFIISICIQCVYVVEQNDAELLSRRVALELAICIIAVYRSFCAVGITALKQKQLACSSTEAILYRPKKCCEHSGTASSFDHTRRAVQVYATRPICPLCQSTLNEAKWRFLQCLGSHNGRHFTPRLLNIF